MLLCGGQSVAIDKQSITFRSRYQTFSLNFTQFENFNDVIRQQAFLHLSRFPLGRGVWFNLRNLTLVNSKSSFQFCPDSWNTYLTRTHSRIYSFVRNAKRQNHQFHARNKAKSSSALKPRRLASTIGRQIVSGSPSNASSDDVQQSKNSNFSRWLHSNSRQRS